MIVTKISLSLDSAEFHVIWELLESVTVLLLTVS